MIKKIKENIHIVKEKYFIMIALISLILTILFIEQVDIVLPLSLLILTTYYFISLNTTCPKCDRPFAKKTVQKKVISQTTAFTEKDLDYYDTIYTEREKDFKCKYCSHKWKNIRETKRHQ